jgi:pilus assembly protein CpaF
VSFGRRPGDSAVNGAAKGKAPQPAAASFAIAAKAAPETDGSVNTPVLCERVIEGITENADAPDFTNMSRSEVASYSATATEKILGKEYSKLNLLEQRAVITDVVNKLHVQPVREETPEEEDESSLQASDALSAPVWGTNERAAPSERKTSSPSVTLARNKVQPELFERIDISAALSLPRDELTQQISEIVLEISAEERLQLNKAEQEELVQVLLDEMLGLGPIEPLLADESITDIMVNGHNQVYVERRGKLVLTDVKFRDDRHVMNVATRIVSQIGRRVDESSPLVDARLTDGSRVNIIIPPLAIDGPTISIRKFSKKKITLDVMERQSNLSPSMAAVLKIASRAKLNILISGGTGSGKTTLLNAMSQMIDHGDRIVTIEDAAELQLQQPHVVRLETRPSNLEGQGAISMRDLVKNALRMRPDRIILGEVRGSEALDMLQAMNTGHEGSMSTVHANRPREALTRLENMVSMAGVSLPPKAVRTQIAAAIDIIIQISRMRDGIRRITHVMEVVGMEDDIITTQDLFNFEYTGEDSGGTILGEFNYTGVRPHFSEKAEYFGLERALLEALR